MGDNRISMEGSMTKLTKSASEIYRGKLIDDMTDEEVREALLEILARNKRIHVADTSGMDFALRRAIEP